MVEQVQRSGVHLVDELAYLDFVNRETMLRRHQLTDAVFVYPAGAALEHDPIDGILLRR